MRSEKAFKNSITSFVVQFGIVFLSFIVRKVFVLNLDISYLGYEGVFANIFNLMSVAELGLGNIITFHLYQEIANDNKNEISKLMTIYKWYYRIVAGVVGIIGVILFFFLPYIIKDGTFDQSYVNYVYLIHLVGVIAGYFLAYKRTLLSADQKDYICVEVDFISKIGISLAQIIGLILCHNFILYICTKIVGEVLANIVIAIILKIKYPYLGKKVSVKVEDLKSRNMFQDAKNFLVHKIAYLIFGATDNIMISAFCGIREVALRGNYVLVATNISSMFFYKLLNPIQASIGSYVYSDNSIEDHRRLFNMFDMCSYLMAVFMSTGFITFFQPFITVWLGKEYQLPMMFVVVYSLSVYLSSAFEIVYKYRCSFGDYNQDRNSMVVAAILNITLNFILVQKMGIIGIQIGTCVGLLAIIHGRVVFVVKNYLKQSVAKYYCKHIIWLLFAMIQCGVLYFLTARINEDILGIMLRLLVWGVSIIAFNFGAFHKTDEFTMLLGYLSKIVNKIKGRQNYEDDKN